MKTCPNCRELNGSRRKTCWKCGAVLDLPSEEARKLERTYQKICPKCGKVYPREAEKCETCGATLGVYSQEANELVKRAQRARPKTPYLLCFLLPPVSAYYEWKAFFDDDWIEKTLVGIAGGAGIVVWTLLILAICWIAGGGSPEMTEPGLEAFWESAQASFSVGNTL